MPSNSASSSRPAQPTLFEKRPVASSKQPGTRVPVGVFVAVLMAVLAILAAVLFTLASHSGPGPNGQTTSGPGTGIIVLAQPPLT